MNAHRKAARDPDAAPDAARREWHRYYGAKRIRHQNLQLELVAATGARRVLEVGPYLGYVTALLDNAGYAVTTLDRGPPAFARPAVPHLAMDLLAPDLPRLHGFDLILCCETLEHLPRPAAEAALRTFRESGARWLVLSVPHNGVSAFLELHWAAPGWFRSHVYAKWRAGLRRFTPRGEPLGHHWELGTREYPMRGWEDAIAAAGWRIRERRFSAPTRSVFHLCEAGGAA